MMDKTQFRAKYLGELTLRNGTHVKFLYPVTRQQAYTYALEAQQLYKTIQKYNRPDSRFGWAVLDDLSLAQFQIVFAATKVYGEKYWQRLHEERKKQFFI